MSRRARSARHLSTILTNAAKVFVRVTYMTSVRAYGVYWTGGPDAAELYTLAIAHANELPELDVHNLRWLRTEPR